MDIKSPIVVIGLGNAFRSDDIVGLLVARRIRELALPGVEVIEGIADGTQLLDAWQGRKGAFVVDCAVSGMAAGHIHRFDGLAQSPPAGFFGSFSTHYIDISAATEMARALDCLPCHLRIYGIEGKLFQPGTEVTREVMQSMEQVVSELRDAIAALP